MKRLLFALFFAVSQMINAQHIAPFSDVFGKQYVFDGTDMQFLESLKLDTFLVGKNAMLYVTSVGRFKAFYKGQVYSILDIKPDFFVTDNWVGYYNMGTLAVLLNDKFERLDGLAQSSGYWYGDSLIVWTSAIGDTKVFYDGKTSLIEQWAMEGNEGKIGDNIFAYTDRSGNFKVFYRGEVKVIEWYTPAKFKVNRDLVVYPDYIGNFKLFYNGESYETNTPYTSNSQLGEGFVVYFDQQNRMNVWYEGETKELSQSRPKQLWVKENMIAFVDQGNNFYVWYQGKMQMMERVAPISLEVYRHILVYQDQYGRLRGLYYGKETQFSENIVSGTWNLYNEVVTYSLLNGQTSIWSNGKTYTYQP
jgi:hypothetical protein